MKIEGKVETIIYKNETNGYTVLLLKVEKDYVTAVGEADGIEVGDMLEFEGQMDTHKVYGEQFKFINYKKVLPKTTSALIQYIADNINGVGKKTATNIVETFGDETIDIIRYKPYELKKVKGMNAQKIDDLSDFFNNEYEKWNSIEYMANLGLSSVVANKIYQVLKHDSIKIINENPYSLIGFVKALDFKTVDKIGRMQMLPLDNEERVDTGIIYAINTITEYGHTCIELDILIDTASSLLEVEDETIINGIARLKFNEKIYIENIDGVDFAFRKSYYLAEENIANTVAMHTMIDIKNKDYSKDIEKVSKEDGIELSDEQKEAVSTCLNKGFSVITGGPGTGKTTIIKCIISILEMNKKDYVLCAPTGRAAKRITQTTGKEAKTLHRLLEITKVDDKDCDTIYETQVRTIESDVVIIDETSMLDCLLMNNLLKAIKKDTQIIMVGDVNQLPSVGPGSVLEDIINSQVVNVVYLKKIYRQSSKSNIIMGAHMVNNGQVPEFKNKDTDLYFINGNDANFVVSEISSLLLGRLEKTFSFDVLKDVQILTPMRKTSLGTAELNMMLQEVLNPRDKTKNERKFQDRIFREEDKVMQVINNYDKNYLQDDVMFNGIYNGDIGYIKKIDNVNQKILIDFDGKMVEYDFDEEDQLEHAYAITIHKSQGSEFDCVILPLFIAYPKLFTRNLLYTAMTRAKKMLIIIGSKKVLSFMVNNIDSKKRKTGLKQKISAKINNM